MVAATLNNAAKQGLYMRVILKHYCFAARRSSHTSLVMKARKHHSLLELRVFVVAAAAVAGVVVSAQYSFCVLAFRDAADTKIREPSIPVSTSTGPDPDKPSGPLENALVPLARAEEDEMMEDVAEMAGGGQVSGQDALANLETTLKPVEKYAVRFLEEVSFATFPFFLDFELQCFSVLKCCTSCSL